jgi:hypothetical protein
MVPWNGGEEGEGARTTRVKDLGNGEGIFGFWIGVYGLRNDGTRYYEC